MTHPIDIFRKEYARQKRLECIVNHRVLEKPKIKKWQVVAICSILPFLLLIFILLPVLLCENISCKIVIPIFGVILSLEGYLRFCLICAVKCYQGRAKEETRRRCKCIPSCSQYAIIALKSVFPLIIALLKIRKRLFVTCNGEEYKVDFPLKRMGKEYERKLF